MNLLAVLVLYIYKYICAYICVYVQYTYMVVYVGLFKYCVYMMLVALSMCLRVGVGIV